MADVTIKEAAARLQVSPDTVRRRLKSGELAGRREPMGSGYRWLIEVPEDAEPEPAPQAEPAGPSAEALELADARARIEGLERLIDNLAAERDHWRETAQHAQGLARVNAETARELSGRPQSLALPAVGPEHTQTSSGGRESLRERLSRWWKGEGA